MEDLKSKIDENKEIQTQLNDDIADRFDSIISSMENIREESVTHD